jgi:hypothetical protein
VVSDSPAVSRRDALRIAFGGAGLALATVTLPRARGDGLQLLDFAEHLVPPEQIKAAGYAGVIVYVSASRPGANFDFKPVTRQYADGLRANGLQIVSVYQYGKPGWPTPSDYTRGYDGGVADAQTALQLHGAAGGTVSAPIFFSVDEDIAQPTWNAVAVQWFRGINSVLGAERTGIYGHAKACGWAIADGVVGHSTTPGFRWAWQTRAWSAGAREPAAVLFQTAVNTAATPGPLIGDVHVDVDDVLAPDYGQWDLPR